MPTLSQYAVILYTLRDYVKTRDETLRTFDKIAEIGYQSVQVSGMDRDIMEPEEIAAELKQRGIQICATHEPGEDIINNTDKVIERLQKLGAKHTAYPYPGGVDVYDPQAVRTWIAQLDEAGQKLREAGLTLSYHNHHIEFLHIDGKTILDLIYEGTSPDNMKAELDTYWVQRGGGCILSWINKMKGRMPLLHLKDFCLTAEKEPDFAEIGSGNMDFPSIIKAAEAAGCEYYIVEQDTCHGDPFDSIAQSFDYIKNHLVTI